MLFRVVILMKVKLRLSSVEILYGKNTGASCPGNHVSIIYRMSHEGTTENYVTPPTPKWMKVVLVVGRYIVLALSVVMILWITRDTLDGLNLETSASYMTFQFWVCIFFLADILFETLFNPPGRRMRWLGNHWLFVLVSIPWLSLCGWLDVHLPPLLAYIIKFVPMIRTGYVVALVTGALSARKTVSLMWVYILWVAASVYFGSLVFYVEETPVNPSVDSWGSALWWASVSMTTLGSSINEITPTGRVLAFILSAEGEMLLPVFTVYIAGAITSLNNRSSLTLDSFRPDSATAGQSQPASDAGETGDN